MINNEFIGDSCGGGAQGKPGAQVWISQNFQICSKIQNQKKVYKRTNQLIHFFRTKIMLGRQ